MIDLLLSFQDRLAIIALLFARIVPIFMLLPVLNSGVLSNMMIRNSAIMAIVIGIWPVIEPEHVLVNLDANDFFILAIKETAVGSAIGLILALPFWIFSAMGSYIDTARDSSMGSLMDPTSGQESTETANFINFCVCAMYMQLGGLTLMMETLLQSYRQIGLTEGFTVNLDVLLPYLCVLFERGFVLAAPVLLTLFLTEVMLGLLSRFTPQLNAFSVAMTVKSVIAISILSLYFGYMMPDQLPTMMHDYAGWNFLIGSGQK